MEPDPPPDDADLDERIDHLALQIERAIIKAQHRLDEAEEFEPRSESARRMGKLIGR